MKDEWNSSVFSSVAGGSTVPEEKKKKRKNLPFSSFFPEESDGGEEEAKDRNEGKSRRSKEEMEVIGGEDKPLGASELRGTSRSSSPSSSSSSYYVVGNQTNEDPDYHLRCLFNRRNSFSPPQAFFAGQQDEVCGLASSSSSSLPSSLSLLSLCLCTLGKRTSGVLCGMALGSRIFWIFKPSSPYKQKTPLPLYLSAHVCLPLSRRVCHLRMPIYLFVRFPTSASSFLTQKAWLVLWGRS